MINRGVATFTLDYGKCPAWLFERMVKLSRRMIYAIIAEEGPDEFIERLGDPVWFQSFGTVLAFDWNASGLTTILTAALKEAIRREEKDLGIFICGGKGKTSLKTPEQIANWGEKLNFSDSQTQALVYNSKMSAKVDSSLVQDGYQLYHHTFFFTKNGAWTVVQQGMDKNTKTARRYHWHSTNARNNADLNADQRGIANPPTGELSRDKRGKFDLINEPHSGIASQKKFKNVLNLTAQGSSKTREVSAELVSQNFNSLFKDILLLEKYSTNVSRTTRLKTSKGQLTFLDLEDIDFETHPVVEENFKANKYLQKILWKLCAQKPENYEKLLATPGVGPKTMRALALVAEVIYGAKPSYVDPARYSFAHGGKDTIPYPVDRPTYDKTIELMRKVKREFKE